MIGYLLGAGVAVAFVAIYAVAFWHGCEATVRFLQHNDA